MCSVLCQFFLRERTRHVSTSNEKSKKRRDSEALVHNDAHAIVFIHTCYEEIFKVTPLVYAIYFPTIDFLQIFFDNTTISTSYYVNCFFAKKSLKFF